MCCHHRNSLDGAFVVVWTLDSVKYTR